MEWAREQELEVFRACATGKVDRESFLNTFEENGFCVSLGKENDDPQEYSLSSYKKFRDVKRFMAIDSRFGVPFKIAKGITNPVHGICLETKEWKKRLGIKYKGSHVDWWLYEDAEPWKEFEEVIIDESGKDILLSDDFFNIDVSLEDERIIGLQEIINCNVAYA